MAPPVLAGLRAPLLLCEGTSRGESFEPLPEVDDVAKFCGVGPVVGRCGRLLGTWPGRGSRSWTQVIRRRCEEFRRRSSVVGNPAFSDAIMNNFDVSGVVCPAAV